MALTSGYHAAFLVGALFAVGAAILSAALPTTTTETSEELELATV